MQPCVLNDGVIEYVEGDGDSRVLRPDCKGWSRYSSRIWVGNNIGHIGG